MVAVVAKQDIHPVFLRPDLESLIQEGPMEIGPGLAQRILAERVYDRQRPRRNPDVLLWAERLKRGSFQQRRQIWFGVLDGRLHLIDGQHRLAGVVASTVAANFDIMFMPLSDQRELHEAFLLFDMAGRQRSTAEMLSALGLADEHGLSRNASREVYRAAILIHFRYNPPHAEADPLAVRDPEQRLSYTAPLWKLAAQYEKIVSAAPRRIKGRLLSAQIMSVALVTLRHREALARTFWESVAKNDGLRKGDPAHTLLVWLSEQLMGRAGYNGAVAASLAWNAYYESRQIGALKVGSVREINIKGAPNKGPLI